jgi:hypothetical protein
MRVIAVVLLLLAGCRKINENYCPPDDLNCPNLPRCEISDPMCICYERFCVECTTEQTQNCGELKPYCGNDNRCRGCQSNDECSSSSACLENRACADPGRVIAASPNGSNTSPCGAPAQPECSIMQALVEVSSARDIIRLAPGTYTLTGVGVDGLDFSAKSATVIARGATITRMAPNGAIMSARNGQTLKLIGGTLQGPNNTTDGLKCNTDGKLFVHETTIEGMIESGIETERCELTVSRTTIRRNQKGGINMVTTAGVATITNNFVYLNGSDTSPIGGMSLLLASGSKLEFNTVVSNTSNTMAGLAGGIACTSNSYEPRYNIVYRNVGGPGGAFQVVGTCTFVASLGYTMAAATPDENAVLFEDPSPTNPNFHLTEMSPVGVVREMIDCTDVIDVDGDQRPQPVGRKCDYGADEWRPNSLP